MPPLNSLVAFEAAARHLSFTLAAAELNVTQGAISRQVRLLEEYLGTALFERTTRRIDLNSTGAQYYEAVHATLTQLARATGNIRHWRGAQQVTVLTSTALASLWLLPKVAEFQRENEEIELRIIANDHVKDMARLDCDLAVFYCRTPPKDVAATPLFAEEIFPVCSPDYLAKHPDLKRPEDLASCTWLWLDDQPGQLHTLTGLLTAQRINILHVGIHRLGPYTALGRVGLDLIVETRDRAHADDVIALIQHAGYPVEEALGSLPSV